VSPQVSQTHCVRGFNFLLLHVQLFTRTGLASINDVRLHPFSVVGALDARGRKLARHEESVAWSAELLQPTRQSRTIYR
jgi:hypothetical protein